MARIHTHLVIVIITVILSIVILQANSAYFEPTSIQSQDLPNTALLSNSTQDLEGSNVHLQATCFSLKTREDCIERHQICTWVALSYDDGNGVCDTKV